VAEGILNHRLKGLPLSDAVGAARPVPWLIALGTASSSVSAAALQMVQQMVHVSSRE
jgi:hypothetical protein